MKRLVLTLITVALLFVTSTVSFGQTVQIVRMDGTVENVQIRSFDTEPKTIRIKPYGLNLQPANVPERKSEYVPRHQPYNPGPVTIENPYFPEKDDFPEPENTWTLETYFRFIGALIGEYHKACHP